MRLPTEAEFELVARGGVVFELHDFPGGDNPDAPDITSNGIRNLGGGAEWVADGYRAEIGCAHRLSASEICPSGGCSCSGCEAQCLPGADGALAEGNDGGSLTCAPGFGAPEIDPVFAASTHGVVRGGERECHRRGYTRRHVVRGGASSFAFRCVKSAATPRPPAEYRFRLNNCPSGSSVDVSREGESRGWQLAYSVDGGPFQEASFAGVTALNLPCRAVFVGRSTDTSTLSIRATSRTSCVQTWRGTADLSGGDFPATGVAVLDGESDNCGQTCGGANLMTDNNNCGVCGHSCLGAPCVGGACVPAILSSGHDAPFALAVDVDSLYWTNRASAPDGGVWRCQLSNMSCGPLVTSQGMPSDLLLESGTLYWANGEEGTIRGCDQGGCGDMPFLFDTPLGIPLGLAVQGGRLLYSLTMGGTVRQCDLPDCNNPPQTLVTGQGLVGPVAADNSWVYYGTLGMGGSLRRCPRNGCGAVPAEIIVSNVDPGQLRLDGFWLYFTDGNGTVNRWDTSGDVREILVSGMQRPSGLAVEATQLFWTVAGDGTVRSCVKDQCSSTMRVIASGQGTPLGIVHMSGVLFWANSTGGQIMGMAAPPPAP
jgi:hypothetical protein